MFVERYRDVRARIAEAIRGELGDELPAGLTADGAASLLIAVMDGLPILRGARPDSAST